VLLLWLLLLLLLLLLLQVAFASCPATPGCTSSGSHQQPSSWQTSSTP
jgi:hypothetical protein